MATILDLYKNLEKTLDKLEIPPRPQVLDRIILEMREDDPDFRKLSALISADVSLAASLIKTVNSPFFGLQRKSSSVHDALMLMGLELAARIIAGILLRHAFPRRPELEPFWDQSLKVAILSHWLARQLGSRDGVRADAAYTFGLFRDAGMAVMTLKFNDYRQTAHAASQESESAFTDVEQAKHHLNHAVIGAKLAETWQLPEDMHRAILFHHAIAKWPEDLEMLSVQSARFVALSQLAEKILQDHNAMAMNMEWPKLGAASLSILGLDEPQMAEIESEAINFVSQELTQLAF
jgi:HD-like signal output (HDOD) protein